MREYFLLRVERANYILCVFFRCRRKQHHLKVCCSVLQKSVESGSPVDSVTPYRFIGSEREREITFSNEWETVSLVSVVRDDMDKRLVQV